MKSRPIRRQRRSRSRSARPFFGASHTTTSPFFQAKMEVGPANSPQEATADRMADAVLQRAPDAVGPEDEVQRQASLPAEQLHRSAEEEEPVQMQAEEEEVQAQTEEEEPVQMQAEEEEVQAQVEEEEVQAQAEEEEPVQMQAEEEEVQAQAEEEEVQAKPAAHGAGGTVLPQLAQQIRARQGRGVPLPAGIRQHMEAAFGANFRPVRIHTDAPAARLSRQLGARAFAVGRDVFFNRGEFDPHASRGKHLLAHELTHTLQQGAISRQPAEPTPPAPAALQRSPGESHNLTAPELSGQSELENTFDGAGTVRRGQSGPAVRTLQQALLDLGFALPQFGADGIFGAETEAALRAFQQQAGLTPDGIAGQDTLGVLDLHRRNGQVTTDTDTDATDRQVIEKYARSADEPLMLFFLAGSATLDAQEQAKIPDILAKHGHLPVTLRGFASDEGPNAVNADLAARRIDAVAAAMFAAGYNDVILHDNAWEVGQNNVQYGRMRSVKVVPAGMEHLDTDTLCPAGSATAVDCATQAPALEAAYAEAVAAALGHISDAEAQLPLTDPAALAQFDQLFGTAADPNLRQTTQAEVKRRLGLMRDFLASTAAPNAHTCGTNCHPTCQAGAPAFNQDGASDTEENPAGRITVCQGFLAYTPEMRARILVHEGHHGAPGYFSHDAAYGRTRLITLLSAPEALSNAASFELLVMWLHNPSEVVVGQPDDTYSADLTENERHSAHAALAWPHQWVIRSVHLLSAAYQRMVRQRRDGTGYHPDSPVTGLIGNLAGWFHFLPPPLTPGEHELTTVAALFDRTQRMDVALEQALNIHKASGAASSWEPGPGARLELAPGFFLLPPDRQMTAILQELVHATPGISANFEPGYVMMFYHVKDILGLGPS